MAVTLVNDDLRGFITRWDAVIAGMTSEPDTMWKQAYFHNAIKNFKPLSHDLAVYDRTPEGEPNRSYDFLMKAARDYLERKSLAKMRQATKKSLSGKKEAAPAPTRPSSAGKPQGICYDFQAGNAPEERIADINMRSLTKAKVEVRKVNLDQVPEAPVVLCLPDLGINFASFGRRENVTVGVNVLFSIRPNLQLRLPKTTSVGRARTRGRRRRRVIGQGHQVGGSNSSKGSQSLKDKGGKPSSSGSAAVCLMRALMMVAVINPSTSTHRVPEGFASTPFHYQRRFAMPVTRNRFRFF